MIAARAATECSAPAARQRLEGAHSKLPIRGANSKKSAACPSGSSKLEDELRTVLEGVIDAKAAVELRLTGELQDRVEAVLEVQLQRMFKRAFEMGYTFARRVRSGRRQGNARRAPVC
jgi:hypothetical protein